MKDCGSTETVPSIVPYASLLIRQGLAPCSRAS
jgi:hypothetical protein